MRVRIKSVYGYLCSFYFKIKLYTHEYFEFQFLFCAPQTRFIGKTEKQNMVNSMTDFYLFCKNSGDYDLRWTEHCFFFAAGYPPDLSENFRLVNMVLFYKLDVVLLFRIVPLKIFFGWERRVRIIAITLCECFWFQLLLQHFDH